MSEPPGSLVAAQVALMSQLPRIRKQTAAQYGKYADLAAKADEANADPATWEVMEADAGSPW